VSRRSFFVALLALVLTTFVARRAEAHKPSDAYVHLSVEGAIVRARWDVSLRDLADATDLDGNEDGEVTWAEAKRIAGRARALAEAGLTVVAERSPCPVRPPEDAAPRIVRHADGAYLVLTVDYACPAPPTSLELTYSLFFDRDPQHRGIVALDSGAGAKTCVLAAARPSCTLAVDGGASATRGFTAMVGTGLEHIAEGTDHLAFLFALLFPAVLVRRERSWDPAVALGPVVRDVLRVVTAFTIAHSLTLGLSAFGLVRLPSRLVESVIAASVVLAALNNVAPLFREGRWSVAFSLGLVHGFGFSATLEDLSLAKGTFVASLLGFNVGVELGQLVVVAAFLPVAFALRRTLFYRRGVLTVGSLALAALGVVWLAERALSLRLLGQS
jgi:hypothetical protein